MNLLPKTHEEFSKSDYWNSFFKKRGEKSFEWYGEYLELCEVLNKYIRPKDKILMVGCGNSKLSMDMYDTGFKDLVNIDISQIVINQMNALNRNIRPDMQFLQMDATQMSFNDEQFSVILDKGTLDALMTSNDDDVIAIVQRYFREMSRVLRNGGRYVCISLLQEHIANFVVNYFPKNGFMLRVVRCIEAETVINSQNSDLSLPIFAIIATKFPTLKQSILEICFAGDTIQRVSSEVEILNEIDSIQKTVLIFNSLKKKALDDKDEELVIDLCHPNTNKSRYTLILVEQAPQRGNSKYGAFIVPQGRETEWIFSTKEGRKKLLNSAKHNRLAIIILHRDQEYESLEKIQEELDGTLLSLKPNGMKEKIPYLSVGSDVGKRELIAKGSSKYSGEYRIEDVNYDEGKIYRRLIFMNNPNVIQSEALVEIYKRKTKEQKKINLNYLACEHHIYISIAVKLALKSQKNIIGNVLVIGLGGGSLCSFIHGVLNTVQIQAVEIDSEMAKVAENYFGLKLDNRMEVIIEDGLDFLKHVSTRYNVIVFDVDNKELSEGMSCPPKEFLSQEILNKVKILIESDGIFILNLVCRDENLRNKVITQLKEVFTSICSYKLEEEVNEIVFCFSKKENFTLDKWRNEFKESGQEINSILQKKNVKNSNFKDLNDFMNNLSLS